MPFQFRLRTILKLRQRDRDQQQQSVFAAQMNLSRQLADLDRLAHERTAIIDELREMNNRETWTLDQVLAGKRHAAQLGQAISASDSAVFAARNQLEHCLVLLLQADQSVKALERLSERQNDVYQDSQRNLAAKNDFTV